jgi:hypothetical protein
MNEGDLLVILILGNTENWKMIYFEKMKKGDFYGRRL